ncbi:ABATE domain-containing protein [Micromonospora sp. CPCC 206060]|uniref:CGNR zinc finger domain-containing protein n=1 Tax=Micromonospora sp. CPCC 206060 TaxID=3122406 RepID=UPI002FF40CBC
MSFVFVSGNLALDFAGTLKWRRSAPEEFLDNPEDLARWAVESGLLTERPPVDADGLGRLRALREAVYRLVVHGMQGRDWPADDLATVNQAAGAAPARNALTPAGVVRTGDAESIASAVARAAIDLLGEIDTLRVRECGRPGCTRIFVDRSRGGNRQWCGMEECGNRIKAAQYRVRKSRVAGAASPG